MNEEIRPGFLGEAMRDEEASNIASNLLKPKDEFTVDEVQINPDLENILIKNNINIMNNTSTQAEVISGKNQADLKANLNTFLTANPDINILSTDLSTTGAGLYYVILHNAKVEMV